MLVCVCILTDIAENCKGERGEKTAQNDALDGDILSEMKKSILIGNFFSEKYDILTVDRDGIIKTTNMAYYVLPQRAAVSAVILPNLTKEGGATASGT